MRMVELGKFYLRLVVPTYNSPWVSMLGGFVAYLGDALGALDIAQRDAVCLVSLVSKNVAKVGWLVGWITRQTWTTFDYDAS